jgi:hypothetical protein
MDIHKALHILDISPALLITTQRKLVYDGSVSNIPRTSQSKRLSSCRCVCSEERLFSQCGHSCSMSRLVAFIVPRRIMDRDSIIPKCRCTRSPLESNLNVYILFVHVVQIVEDNVALGFVEANNPDSHRSIYPQRLPAGCWMNTNKRVHALYVLWSSFWVVAVKIGVCTAVDSLLSLSCRMSVAQEGDYHRTYINDLSEVRRQLLIRSIA